jgi:hypothetical protein
MYPNHLTFPSQRSPSNLLVALQILSSLQSNPTPSMLVFLNKEHLEDLMHVLSSITVGARNVKEIGACL